jgi:hypothetical protein
MRTPKDAFDLSHHQPEKIDRFQVVATWQVLGHQPDLKLVLRRDGSTVKTLDSFEWRLLWEMTEAMSLATTQYGRIKANPHWQGLHDVARRPIYYVTGGTLAPKFVDETVSCRDCGLIMPLDAATIDHHHPKAGGDIDAARRVLRAIGLTQQAPNNIAGQLISIESEFARDRLGYGACQLSYIGMIFYTCLHLSGKYAEFSRKCLNHFVNLDPMCFKCNSKKGAWGY